MIDILSNIMKLTQEYSTLFPQGDTDGFIEWLSLSKKIQKHHNKVENSALISSLMSSSINIKSKTKEIVKKLNLTSIDDFYYLKEEEKHQKIAKGILINELHHEIPTGSEIIKRLIKIGLLNEEVDNGDKRVKLVSLTPQAQTLLAILTTQLSLKFSEILQQVSEDDKVMLVMLLRKLT